MQVHSFGVTCVGVVCSLLVCVGCGAPANTFVEPPPPEVTVAHPVEQMVPRFLDLTGTTTAIESVDVRARVQGFLEKAEFTDGAMVEASDLLFVIDPKPYQAKVDQAAAALRSADAELKFAQIDLDKATQLREKKVVSEIEFVEKTGKRDQARAEVGVAEANLRAAQLDLDYTQVLAPISGRTGRRLVDIGNLVGARDKTLLTTIVNDASVYAYANLSEYDFLRLNRHYRQRSETAVTDREEKPEALLGLADETGYPHVGRVDFVDNQVDPDTGTLRLRAVFPNPDHLLGAGMFVRFRIPLGEQKELLVPDTAVLSGQGGRYVLVIGPNDMVEQRSVTTGSLFEQMRVIRDGVTTADRVIISNLQRVRPGISVKPVAATPKKKAA